MLRWPGALPFGSDHDEYRLVAEALLAGDGATVAAVEGTKYPVGYPGLLAGFDAVGLDPTVAALVLNVALVMATVALVWLLARRLTPEWPWTGLAVAALVALSPSLWGSVYAVMPDLALVFVTALALAAAVRWLPVTDAPPLSDADAPGHIRTGVLALSVLAVLATLLKTQGLVLAGALGVGLLATATTRRWAWAPPAAGFATAGASALLTAGHPEHTTGYAATFWLRDPYDAAAGSIAAADLPARLADNLDPALTDLGRALLFPRAPEALAIALLVALTAAAVLATKQQMRWTLGAFVAGTVLVVALWPFRSVRFGLSLLPVAAIGAAALLAVLAGALHRAGAAAGTARVAAAVAVGVVLAGYATVAVPRIDDAAAAEGRQLDELHAATDEAVAWLSDHVGPDEQIASMDYRELAYRLPDGRKPVLPVSYTSDPDDLLAQTAGAGADWLVVVRGLYPRREARIEELLSTYPRRFDLAHQNPRIDVFRIDGGSRT